MMREIGLRQLLVGGFALAALTWLILWQDGPVLARISRLYLPTITYYRSFPLLTPTPSPTPPSDTSPVSPVVGVMGVPTAAFPEIVPLRSNTVEYRGSTEAKDIQAAFDAARAQRLHFLVRGPSRRLFTTPDGRLDVAAVDRVLHTMFDGTSFLEDPAFLGVYLIDEPCHPNKYNLTGSDLVQLYTTVKAYHPNLNLFINFGQLSGCFDTLLTEAKGAPIVDIAAFTVTVRKTDNPLYLPAQVETARQAKAADAHPRIVPMLAIWEGANMPMPSEQWVRDTGQFLAAADTFDGVLVYPWATPSWATRSLDDVIDTYADDVQWVFSAFLAEE